jgi:HAD superfamily hydrolase (TIGR01509 family)
MKPSPAVRSPAFRLPRRPKAVVFDLDGTLIDSEALVLESYMAAADRHRVPFSHEQFLSLVGRSREQSSARMMEFFGQDFPLASFYDAVSNHIGDRAAPLKPGVAELLEHLDQSRLPYALATSSGPGWVTKHFAAHKLENRFRHIVTRDDVANGKPHPEPYLKASTALGYSPADILAVEDSPTGIRSAHAAGLMAVLIPDLIQPDDETRDHALHVGGSLHDVLEMLKD